MNWPLVAVHANLLNTGQVLVWDGFEAGPNSERLFDPATGALTPKPYARNLFCAGQAQLADGKLFIAGGHVTVNEGLRDTTIWDPVTGTATRKVDMAGGRWYPTVTTLADGRALVYSGDNIEADDSPPGSPLSFKSHTVPEVYDPVANAYTRLTGAQIDSPLYPFQFVLPDGRVFNAGPNPATSILNPQGSGSITAGPTSPFDGSSAVMYSPGKVMKSGTWSDPSFANRTVTGRTAVVDMNAGSPGWRETAAMAHPRSYETLTALPDGSVIVTGGTGKSDGIDMSTAVLPAEIWNPQTETWTTMAAQQNGRGYHSTALLLPDGRVLQAGGGQLPGYPVTNQTNAQIFSPPYLFKGIRPTITSAPSTVQYGSSFSVGTLAPESIGKVSLVRLGSSTHAFDQNQRFVPLSFTAGAGALQVDAPANSRLAPPGYYMLFILNSSGVPSVAKMVRLPSASEDNQAPTAPSNLTASGAIGSATLNWSAASDDTGVVRYNVHRSTTPGFTPSAANRIAQPTGQTYTDTGLASGTYFYVVKAEDQAGNIGPSSNEASATVSADTTLPSVSVTAPAEGATLSGSVNVTAGASDDVGVAGVQFKLDGQNLGAEDTAAPYSTSWNTATATNAAHTLTAVARDAAGNTRTATVVNVTVNNSAPPPSAPRAAWGFDEASGASVGDASGQGNIGSVSGALRTAAGKYGGALTFDGVNDLVTVPDANSLDLTSGMTLEAWVRPTTVNGWSTAILKETTGNLVYSLYAASAYGGNGAARPSAWINAADVGGTSALPANTWSHIATTYDRATWRLYVNGVQVASKAYTAAIPVSTGALRIGGNSIWGEWFAGQIDEVRVYNRALSALEVAADRDTPIGAPPPPDSVAPSVSLTAPAAGALLAGSRSLTANASDNVGVAGVQFKRDGQNVGVEDTSAPYSVSWDTTGVADGAHTLTAVARDAAGNTASAANVDVTVDNTAPSVSVSSPAEGATVSGTVAVNGAAADGDAVAGVQFRLDGQNLGAEDTSAPYSASWDTAGATNGPHTLTAIARDRAGNTRTATTVNVTVNNAPPPDVVAPSVSLTAPAAGALLAGSRTLSANASDNVGVVGVQFKRDGQDVGAEDTSAPYSVSWDTTGVADGPHSLTAVARDAAGNTTSATTVDVTVDNTAPSVSISAPGEGATVGGTVAVNGAAADGDAVAGVQFRLDGQNLGSEDTTAPYSASWNTTTATNGPHTLTAIARDRAGNTRTAATVNVTVDNAPPPDSVAPSVSLTAPAAGALLAGSRSLSANASDNVGVAGVQFKRDGQDVGAEDTSAPYSVSWDTTGVADGAHTLTAVARDAAGNTASAANVNVTVDNTAPSVSVSAPAEGATVSGTVAVNGTAADADAVAGVQFRLDGQNLGAEDTSAPYSASWSTAGATNGPHTLTAIARDRAGNTRTATTVNVTVNNTGPVGLVAAYGFDEPSGTTVADASGTGNTGTISGATRSTTAKFVRSLSFDGNNDWVTVPDANSLDLTTGMTLEAWVRPTAGSLWRTAIIKETTGNLAYALYSASQVGSALRPASWIASQGINGTTAIALNTWTHLATTFDGATWRLYVNGAQVATRALATPIPVSSGALRFGGNSIWGEWFQGQLDEIRVYNRGLSAAEVLADRDRPVNP